MTRVVPLVLAGVLALTVAAGGQKVEWPGAAWPRATPESEGLLADALDTFDRDIKSAAYGHIDRLFVTRRGRAVVDATYARDYHEISRGRVSPIGCGQGCTDAAQMHHYNYLHPRWHPFYEGRSVHTLQSVTKSVAATVLGVALQEDRLRSLDTPMLDFFREYKLANPDARLRKATLDDVLTMRTGMEWHEQDRPLNETNTTIQLERSADWIQFTLDQPMDAEPRTKWAYNSGGSMLLSGIVRTATSQHIDEYARAHLFAPIGIRDFHWKRTPTGHPDTEGGLYLTAEDLARIGYLYLRDGVWNGRRILPAGWVSRATMRHVTGVAPGWDYGYQWWLTRRGEVDVWAGRGFGGQLLIVVPSRDIVAVVLAWNVFGTPAGNPFGALLQALGL